MPVIVLGVVALLAALHADAEAILDKAEKEYDAGRYREAVFLIRHHFKKGGNASPELLFLFGKAWLKTGKRGGGAERLRGVQERKTRRTDRRSPDS